MRIIDEFLEHRLKNISEKSQDTFKDFYKRMETYFPEGKEPNQLTNEDFVYILSSFQSVSSNSFRTVKTNIKDFIEWAVDRREMSIRQLSEFSKIKYKNVDSSEKYELYFFSGFEELRESLEDAIECICGEREENDSFDTLRCVIYLLWYGFKPNEVINVEKSDVDVENAVVYKGEEKIPVKIGLKTIQFINDYARSYTYSSERFGKSEKTEFSYKSGKYLVRTCKNAQLNTTQLKNLMKDVNDQTETVGKKFTVTKIMQSGIFCRSYSDERENGDIDRFDHKRMAILFDGIDEADLSEYYKHRLSYVVYPQFQRYKQTFYAK